jgi:UDP-hydrolysing UDP-N-acetyl-D-glucosamine 2-epimerase
MTKRIAILTGKRGGYDAMLPLMRSLQDADWCHLTVLACDQHLYEKFGSTVDTIEQEPFEVVRLRMSQAEDTKESRCLAMAQMMSSLTAWVNGNPIDYLVVFGDRLESLTAAQVAHCFNIPIVHIQGGDKTGTQDDQTRWAITELASHHLVSNMNALVAVNQRRRRFPARCVGDLHVDNLLAKVASPVEVQEFLGFLPVNFFLGLFHPDTRVPSLAPLQINNILNGVDRYRGALHPSKAIWVYPCTDIGHEGILTALDHWGRKDNNYVYSNIPHDIFLWLLYETKCLVGNSSAGIIEAPYTNTWAVDVGDRQLGRVKDNNIISAAPSAKDVCRAVRLACEAAESPVCQQLYGDGRATEMVFAYLEVL